jgi:hypothetical protein
MCEFPSSFLFCFRSSAEQASHKIGNDLLDRL